MTIFEMDAVDGGNDDENAPSTAGLLLSCVKLLFIAFNRLSLLPFG